MTPQRRPSYTHAPVSSTRFTSRTAASDTPDSLGREHPQQGVKFQRLLTRSDVMD